MGGLWCSLGEITEEFFRKAFREKFYDSVEALQKELDSWLVHYNTERPHGGYRNMGKRPIENINSYLQNARHEGLLDTLFMPPTCPNNWGHLAKLRMIMRPNFFLVGASKAGTTSLSEVLRNHPDVFMCQPKEPDFFSSYDKVPTIPVEEIERYLSLFEESGNVTIVGEASVSYLSSDCAARHIHEFNPDAKILISLRNPLERVRSLYEMYVRHGLKQNFEYATMIDPWLTRQCFYYDCVRRFYDTFPDNQIHWINFDDIRLDWSDTLNEIYHFLGIEPLPMERPVLRNTGGFPKNKAMSMFTNRSLVAMGKLLIPKRFHNYFDTKLKSVVFKKYIIHDRQIKLLRNEFWSDLTMLDQLLSSDLRSRWL